MESRHLPVWIARPPYSAAQVDTIARNDSLLNIFITYPSNQYHSQITHTFYDSVAIKHIPLHQQNLRKQISSIVYKEMQGTSDTIYDNAIHYSYDIEGNVATILTEVPHDSAVMQRYKRVDYVYDLVSGKVNGLYFQQDSMDQFLHRYQYDADNRITNALTSHDGVYGEQDASYEYYSHGPLAREVIGRRQVQGVDYAYTLNGWIKGVNSSITNPSYDMGQDGNVHNLLTATIGRDAYGFTLNYFAGDYRPIGASKFGVRGLPFTSLYNGNIAGATYSIQPLIPKTIGYTYTYDQLNRMVQMKAFAGIDTVLRQWVASDSISSFREKVSYDENGNILTYLRHGNINVGPLAMDSLNYNYKKGTNQLQQVLDAVPATNYPNDIHNETSKRNYQYNAIGELAKDSAGKLDTIIWNIYGKVKKIVKTNNDSIVFEYDPLGNRLEKRDYTTIADTTTYARDAQGNILAVYVRKKDTVHLTEWDIYGSKRIGVIDTNLLVYEPPPPPCRPYCSMFPNPLDSITVGYLEGQKQYELTNHLGNVLVTVSDRKIAIDTPSAPNVAYYYMPVVINAQDYYPFGMVEPGRQYAILGDSAYGYGMNGMMKDNEVAGQGNTYTADNWEYSVLAPHRFNPDPVVNPSVSPYAVFADNPIYYVDPNGDFQSKFGAWLYKAVHGGHLHKNMYTGEWGVEKKFKVAGGAGREERYDWSGRSHSVKEYENPYSVGWEWLTGTGARDHHFTAGDPFTEMLKQHGHIQETRQLIAHNLANGQVDLNKAYPNNYSLAGWSGIPKYLGDYSTLATFGLTGNLAVTYLGSYDLTYTVTSVDIGKRIATVHFHAHNVSSIASATHPPKIGYSPLWNKTIGDPLNKAFSSGPMSKTEQTFDWMESIKY